MNSLKYKDFIYLFTNSFGVHKIGITKDIYTRKDCISLSSGLVAEVVGVWGCPSRADSFKLEAELHRHFKIKKTVGEWFNLDKEDIVFVKDYLSSLPTYEKICEYKFQELIKQGFTKEQARRVTATP